MAIYRIVLCILSIGLFSLASISHAEESPANQKSHIDFSKLQQYVPDIYRDPQSLTPQGSDKFKTCVALDDEIVTLLPLTYRTIPDFYDDPKVGAAIWLTTTGITLFDFFPDDLPLTEIPLGYSLLAYPEYKKYQEEKRIREVSLRIESLRRTKARMRCFET